MLESLTRQIRCIKATKKEEKEQNGKRWSNNNKHVDKTVQSDIVEPVDEVEEWENGWEDDPWPAVDGVHICQVGDFDFELRGPPPQAAPFHLGRAVQGVTAGWSRADSAALLTVLDVCRRCAVQLHHGLRVSNVCHAGGDLASRYFIMDLQGS